MNYTSGELRVVFSPYCRLILCLILLAQLGASGLYAQNDFHGISVATTNQPNVGFLGSEINSIIRIRNIDTGGSEGTGDSIIITNIQTIVEYPGPCGLITNSLPINSLPNARFHSVTNRPDRLIFQVFGVMLEQNGSQMLVTNKFELSECKEDFSSVTTRAIADAVDTSNRRARVPLSLTATATNQLAILRPKLTTAVNCSNTSGEGGLIEFSGWVTNSGNISLEDIWVNNDQLIDPVLGPVTLAPGEFIGFNGAYQIDNPCTESTSRTTARGTTAKVDGLSSITVSNSASSTCTTVLNPGIAVTRECFPNPAGPGTLQTISGEVANTGDVTLTSILVVDTTFGTITNIDVLEPGEIVPYSMAFTAGCTDLTSSVFALANTICGNAINNSASGACLVQSTPELRLAKICPSSAPVPGELFSFTGFVTNTGNTPINNITITTDFPAPDTFLAIIPSLAPGEVAPYNGSYLMPTDGCDILDTITAAGTTLCNTPVQTKLAQECPGTFDSQLTLTQSCPESTPAGGQFLQWSGTITNTGNMTLSNIVVTSSLPTPDSVVLIIPKLGPNEGSNLFGTILAPIDACQVTNTLSATGTSPCETPASTSLTTICPVNNATIGDFVWEDVNGNGVQDSGEAGIANVFVQLLPCGDNTPLASTQTAPDGSFQFIGLSPDNYRVRFILPDGYQFSRVNSGQENLDSDANPTTGITECIELSQCAKNLSIDAGMFRPACISNLVWEDINGDGIQNDGNSGLAGVALDLIDCVSSNVVQSTTTDTNGFYQFCDLAPGSYQVQLNVPQGLVLSSANTTNVCEDSDADLLGLSQCITTVSGQINDCVDFGLFQPICIGDFVWEDRNRNGIQDDSDSGIGQVQVELINCESTNVVDTVSTDNDGFYQFCDLLPGVYQVRVLLPLGYETTLPNAADDCADSDVDSEGYTECFDSTLANQLNCLDIGLYQPTSVTSYLWEDRNGDGIQNDSNSGISNVIVRLLACDSNGVVRETVTDQEGLYAFENLAPGDYKIQVNLPQDYFPTLEGVGPEATNSDLTAAGETACFTITAGQTEESIDVGLYRKVCIGDYVWEDSDHNGEQNELNAGVPGVVVEAMGCNTTNVIQSTITDTSGFYQLCDLPPGNYRIRVLLPDGYRVSLRNTASNCSDSDVDPDGLTECLSVESGEVLNCTDIGIYRPVRIASRIWEDLNADGVQDAEEPGLPNVEVTLVDCNRRVDLTVANTDAEGNYAFLDLEPGDYSVRVSVPAGYVITQPDASDDSMDSDIAISGNSECSKLSSGQEQLNLDAGLFRPVSLGDFIWEDLDANGMMDEFEPGISNVIVRLFRCNSSDEVAMTLTDETGHYSFSDLVPDNYQIHVEIPSGYLATPQYATVDNLDSDIDSIGVSGCFDLLSGDNETQADGGLYRTVCIGDTVWNDLNEDGIQNESDTGIAGLTLQLIDCDASNTVASTTTDIDGFYQFCDIVPGNYQVVLTLPAGSVISPQGATEECADNDANANGETACVSVLSGEQLECFDIGLSFRSGIGDYVWNDENRNGVQDPEESGIPDVTVQLIACGATEPLSSTMTDSFGYYTFDPVPPGDYYVRFIAPSEWSPTLQNVGDTTNDSDANSSGTTDCFLLTAGSPALGIDAGFNETGCIGNYVWEDINGDGFQDPSETGVSGIMIELLECNSTNVLSITQTDTNGFYQFCNLATDDYVVRAILPEGYQFSIASNTNQCSNSDANAQGLSECVSLAPGEQADCVDFGIFKPAVIGNYAWNDLSCDGVQDGGESGLGGVLVTIVDCSTDTPLGTTTTASDGFYQFNEVPPGNYYLRFAPPGQFTVAPFKTASEELDNDVRPDGTTACIQIVSGQTNLNADAGFCQTVCVGDFVWEDLNQNGVQDPGEPGLPGLTVELLDPIGTEVLATTTTDASGLYQFCDLVGQAYRVRLTVPSGFAVTARNTTDDCIDNDADPTGLTDAVIVNPGENQACLDIGLIRRNSIGDYVWEDFNRDGIQNDADSGMAGVVVRLYDCGTDTELANTTTDEQGFYNFTGLQPGTYYIRVESPADYYFTLSATGLDELGSHVDSSGLSSCISLAPGQAVTAADAGLYRTGCLGGTVWTDENNDGIQNESNAGIPWIVVELIDCVTEFPLQTTLTGPDGTYEFCDLIPGNYKTRVFVPTELRVTKQNTTSDCADNDADPMGTTDPTEVRSGEINSCSDIGLFLAASLGDFVWEDINGDGIQNEVGTGLEGITVRLFDCASSNELAITQTDATGYYLFDAIDEGDYFIRIDLPEGFIVSPANTALDSVDSDFDASGMSPCYSLTKAESNVSADVGLIRTASVGNYVWVDANLDGIQNEPSGGLSSVTVRLYECISSNLVDVTTTDSAGFYLFENVLTGDYFLEFDIPLGFIPTVAGAASDAIDSDIDSGGRTSCITLAQGDNNFDLDAGLVRIAPCLNLSKVSEEISISPGQIVDYIYTVENCGNVTLTDVVVEDDNGTPDYFGDDREVGVVPILHPGESAVLHDNALTPQELCDTSSGLPSGQVIIERTLENDLLATFVQAADVNDNSYGDHSENWIEPHSFGDLLSGERVEWEFRNSNGSVVLQFSQDYLSQVSTNIHPSGYASAGINGDGQFILGNPVHLLAVSSSLEENLNKEPFLSDIQEYRQSSPSLTDPNRDQWEFRHIYQVVIAEEAFGQFGFGTATVIGVENSPAKRAFDPESCGVCFTTTGTARASVQGQTVSTTDDATVCLATSDTVSIGDYVWLDQNGNGQQDVTEFGVEGVEVLLLDCSLNVIDTTVTDEVGQYLFAGLVPASYRIQFVLPEGYSFTTMNMGSDLSDSDANVISGLTDCFSFNPGHHEFSLDAGLSTEIPRLRIERLGTENVVVSWPISASSFVLESSSSLQGPWFASPEAPVLLDNEWSVTLPAPDGTELYFRLKK